MNHDSHSANSANTGFPGSLRAVRSLLASKPTTWAFRGSVNYFRFYNERRQHSSLDGNLPD